MPSPARISRALALALVIVPAVALGSAKTPGKAAPMSSAPPAVAPASAAGDAAPAHGLARSVPGLPAWNRPEHYKVDMVCTNGDQKITLHQYIDGKKVRTDFALDKQTMSMIELGDEPGTMLTIMPEQKQVMKQSRASMAAMMKQAAPDAAEAPAGDAKVEKVGQETVDGTLCDKYQMAFGDQKGVAWIDPTSHFPVRMTAGDATVEWKNYVVGEQPAELFQAPKGYAVMDMDEMMKNMPSGAGAANLGALMGGGPMGAGMGGGVSGMANRAAGNYGNQLGSHFGSTFGSALGASLGGPLGAMAGGYLGGKIGGMVGAKTAQAVVPGK